MLSTSDDFFFFFFFVVVVQRGCWKFKYGIYSYTLIDVRIDYVYIHAHCVKTWWMENKVDPKWKKNTKIRRWDQPIFIINDLMWLFLYQFLAPLLICGYANKDSEIQLAGSFIFLGNHFLFLCFWWVFFLEIYMI